METLSGKSDGLLLILWGALCGGLELVYHLFHG